VLRWGRGRATARAPAGGERWEILVEWQW
jgi:hypothetical protein